MLILRNIRIKLAIDPLEVYIGHQSRSAMAWAGYINHIQIACLDDPVQMDIDKVQARCCPPVPQEPGLYVLFF